MSNNKQKISVDRDRAREVLGDVLRCRSVLSEPTGCDELVATWMRELGFDVRSFRRPGYRGGKSIVARLRGAGDGPVVAFDGHYDTEPADPARWSVDPWSATEKDGAMIARGAVDSKGSLAGMVLALEAIVWSGAELSGDLMLISPGDGEAEFGSAFLMAEDGTVDDVDYIISGEPTGLDEIGVSYLGSSLWRVSVKGRSAHATQPEEGVNAIYQASQVIQAVEEGKLTFRHEPHPFFTPFGIVHGIRNKAQAEIPDECTFIMIVFSVAGMTLSSIEEDLNSFIGDLQGEIPDLEASVSLIPRETHMWLPPVDEPTDSPIVGAIQDAAKAIEGVDAEATKMRIGYVPTAATVSRMQGRDKRPVVVTYGPGDYRQAHSVDEEVSVEEVAKFAEIYANAALSLVG
jgi:Acetylornithine deacetylase/Succinyl-diaminopimelate desuccinylase and related deacylases